MTQDEELCLQILKSEFADASEWDFTNPDAKGFESWTRFLSFQGADPSPGLLDEAKKLIYYLRPISEVGRDDYGGVRDFDRGTCGEAIYIEFEYLSETRIHVDFYSFKDPECARGYGFEMALTDKEWHVSKRDEVSWVS